METGSKRVIRGPYSTGRSPAGRRGVQEGARMIHREGYCGHEVPGALVWRLRCCSVGPVGKWKS